MKTELERIERLETAVMEIRRLIKWVADGNAWQPIWNKLDDIAAQIQHEQAQGDRDETKV